MPFLSGACILRLTYTHTHTHNMILLSYNFSLNAPLVSSWVLPLAQEVGSYDYSFCLLYTTTIAPASPVGEWERESKWDTTQASLSEYLSCLSHQPTHLYNGYLDWALAVSHWPLKVQVGLPTPAVSQYSHLCQWPSVRQLDTLLLVTYLRIVRCMYHWALWCFSFQWLFVSLHWLL